MLTQTDPAIVAKLEGLMRSIPDWPKQGIVFRDITPVLADAAGLELACAAMAAPFRNHNVELVVGTESRGFIFGAAIARELHCGFIPIRKPGKLPGATICQEYELEYGTDKLEIHTDAIAAGRRVLLVDDLLATGGTMRASCQMVEELKGQIVGISFLIELAFLNGRSLLGGHDVHSVITYTSE